MRGSAKTKDHRIAELKQELIGTPEQIGRMTKACLEKINDKTGEDYQVFRNYLLNRAANRQSEIDIEEAVGNVEKMIQLLNRVKLYDLVRINNQIGLGVDLEDDLERVGVGLKTFFKVTFDEKLEPILTPLDADEIWGEQGLDRRRPFVLINTGDDLMLNKQNLFTCDQADVATFQSKVITEAKIVERGVTQYGVPAGTQYLVAINETFFKRNLELIKSYNAHIKKPETGPNSFIDAYAAGQAKLIYGPLISENGVPLPDVEIIENLSRARSFNGSFGTVIANCQTNALVQMMRNLGISEETIRVGVENMRRVDRSNVALPERNEDSITPSTVIFEGSNDHDAHINFMGGAVPALSANHSETNLSLVPLDDHRMMVYQTLPMEVYHPAKKPTAEQKQEEDRIVRVPTIFEQTMHPDKFLNQDPIARKKKVLKLTGLDGFRYSDGKVVNSQDGTMMMRAHSFPHFTMPETPGNEIKGRDPNLLFKALADMMTRESSQDVFSYFARENDVKLEVKRLATNEETKSTAGERKY